MRLIDADALPYDEFLNGTRMVMQSDIDNAPTVDAVEIVRCWYCKHWNSETCGCKRNPSVEPWQDDDYCSYGERSEETASDYYDNEGRLINNQPTCMSVCGERRSDD